MDETNTASTYEDSWVAKLNTENNPVSLINKCPSNEKVLEAENLILQAPQIDLNTSHALSGKCYARTIFIPAGTVLTGAMHNKDQINIVCGDIIVSTSEGMKHFVGYNVIESSAGKKRIGYANADTYWTTIIQTDLDDIEQIEIEMTEEHEKLQTKRLNAIESSKTVLIEE